MKYYIVTDSIYDYITRGYKDFDESTDVLITEEEVLAILLCLFFQDAQSFLCLLMLVMSICIELYLKKGEN